MGLHHPCHRDTSSLCLDTSWRILGLSPRATPTPGVSILCEAQWELPWAVVPRVGSRDKACPEVSSIALTQYNTWLTGRGEMARSLIKAHHNQLFKSTQIIHSGDWIHVSKQRLQWANPVEVTMVNMCLIQRCSLASHPAHWGVTQPVQWEQQGMVGIMLALAEVAVSHSMCQGAKKKLGRHFERIFWLCK